MRIKELISVTEHKLLLATILFSFSLVLSSISLLAVEGYNSYVAEAETEKRQTANDEPRYSGFTCNLGKTYPEVWSRVFSFLFLPFCYLLLRGKAGFSIISFVLLLFPFFNFLYWFVYTRNSIYYGELFIEQWTEKWLYQSNSFDLLLGFLIPILLIWHFTLVCRLFLSWLTNKIDLQ